MKKKYNALFILLGIIIFAYIIYRIGVSDIIEVFVNARYVNLFFVFLFFSLSQAIRIKKWIIMSKISNLKIKLIELIKFYFYTKITGLITPFRSGELIPAFLKKEKDKYFSISLADRFYESFTTLVIILIALFFTFSDIFPKKSWIIIIFFTILLIICYLFFTIKPVYIFFKKIFVNTEKKSKNVLWKIFNFLDKAFISTKKVLSIKNSLILLAITFIATFSDVLFFQYIFKAVNVNIGIIDTIITFSFLTLIIFISPTPSGIGIGDAGYLILATKYNIASESQLISFLILARIIPILIILVYTLTANLIIRNNEKSI